MPSPVRLTGHAKSHSAIQGALLVYAAYTSGVSVADNATVRLDLDNEPQPDVLLWIDEDAGGQSRVSGDDYLEGAPELVVEVAASSASIDMHAKRNVYRRSGVQEYIVWRTHEKRIDWFELSVGEYRPLPDRTAGPRLRAARPRRNHPKPRLPRAAPRGPRPAGRGSGRCVGGVGQGNPVAGAPTVRCPPGCERVDSRVRVDSVRPPEQRTRRPRTEPHEQRPDRCQDAAHQIRGYLIGRALAQHHPSPICDALSFAPSRP